MNVISGGLSSAYRNVNITKCVEKCSPRKIIMETNGGYKIDNLLVPLFAMKSFLSKYHAL